MSFGHFSNYYRKGIGGVYFYGHRWKPFQFEIALALEWAIPITMPMCASNVRPHAETTA